MHSLLLSLIVCSSVAAAPTQDAVRSATVDIDPYLMLPQPISADELPQIARILMLSDAQDAVLSSLFDEYLQSLAALIPQLEELNHRERDRRAADELIDGVWVDRDPPLTMQQMYDRATSIQRDAQRVELEMRRIEDEFFVRIESILAEPQLDRLHEAVRFRKRVAYRARTYDALPGAQVDLIEVLQTLDVRGEEDESLKELMSAYEERLVQLLQARHDVQRRVHLGDLQWLATYVGSGRIDQQAIEARGRIRFRQLRFESAIRRLNISTLEALSFMLDEQEATEVLNRFFRIAHPRIAPESCVPRTRALLHDALNNEELPDGLIAEIEYLRERFLANYRRLQRRLSDLDFDHTERLYRTMSAHVDDRAAHRAGVDALVVDIRALCKQTTQRVEELLASLEEQ